VFEALSPALSARTPIGPKNREIASMSAKQIRYLEEHLPYELLMLRYTHGQISEHHRRLAFNCYLECFAIHARILYKFLTKDEDSRNFEAKDFVGRYKPLPHTRLTGAMDKLNRQILHLSKSRADQPEEKFNTAHVEEIHQWIERAISGFVGALSPELQSHWKEDRADLVKFIPEIGGTSGAAIYGMTGTGPPPPPR
jgi:hypothetical protein